MYFLGGIDLSQKSFILAILAAVSQYFQVHFMSKPAAITSTTPNSFQANLNKSMYSNMKYVFPVFIFIILYNPFGVSLSAAVALYWITSNIFTIGQQIYVNKNEKKELDQES